MDNLPRFTNKDKHKPNLIAYLLLTLSLLSFSSVGMTAVIDLGVDTGWNRDIYDLQANSFPVIPDNPDTALTLDGLRPSLFSVTTGTTGKWGAVFTKDIVLTSTAEPTFLSFELFFKHLHYTMWPTGSQGTPWTYNIFDLSITGDTSSTQFGLDITCLSECNYSTATSSLGWSFQQGTPFNPNLVKDAEITSPELTALFSAGEVLTIEFTLREYERHVGYSNTGGTTSGYHILMELEPYDMPEPATYSLILGMLALLYLVKGTGIRAR